MLRSAIGSGGVHRLSLLMTLLAAAVSAPAAAQSARQEDLLGTPNASSSIAAGAQVESLGAALSEAASVDDLVEGPVDPDEYVVGPGDRLAVIMWGRVNTTRVTTVSPEGNVVVPGYGVAHVGGLTLSRARQRLLRVLRAQVRGTSVEVQLEGVRRFKVYVLGSVARPQAVRATATSRISDVIDRAGGFAPGAARRGILLRRADGSSVLVDVASFIRAGRLSGNPLVREGDVILVPPRGSSFTIGGAVGYPGTMDLVSGDSLATALALAGGALPGALLDRIEYYRFQDGAQQGPFYVDASTVDGRAHPLRDGDRIFVRRPAEYLRNRSVVVTGEVERPGTYVIGVDEGLGSLLARVGGFTDHADSTAISVRRGSLPTAAAREEAQVIGRLDPARLRDSDADFVRLAQTAQPDLLPVDLGAHHEQISLLLEDGDEISVPARSGEVRVVGEVRRPGFVAYRADANLARYVSDAGGYTARADRGHVLVSKMRTHHTIASRDADPIQAGDVIWVGRKPRSHGWTTIRDLLAVTASAATIYVALQK